MSHLTEADLNTEETRQRLFRIEHDALTKPIGSRSADVLWLLELANIQHTQLEKYRKFARAIIELGPDGVEGLVEYLMGNTVPWEDVKKSLEEETTNAHSQGAERGDLREGSGD